MKFSIVKNENHRLKPTIQSHHPRSSVLLMFLSLHLLLHVTVDHMCGSTSLKQGRERPVTLTLVCPLPPAPSFLMDLGSFSSHFPPCHTGMNLYQTSAVFLWWHIQDRVLRGHLLFSSARFPSYPYLGRATPFPIVSKLLPQVLVGLFLIIFHPALGRHGYLVRSQTHIYSVDDQNN